MTSNAVSQDQTPALPEWIRVLPRGAVELSDHREPFMVDEASLLSMAADFRSRGVDLVIDYEHQSLQGDGPRRQVGSRNWRPGSTASGPGWIGPSKPGITWRRRSTVTSRRYCGWTPKPAGPSP